jgi:hypothetical protein
VLNAIDDNAIHTCTYTHRQQCGEKSIVKKFIPFDFSFNKGGTFGDLTTRERFPADMNTR